MSIAAGAAMPAHAQQRDSSATVSLDSLAARLARTDSALRLLQQQVATESASSMRLRSRVQFEWSARLVVNSYRTQGSVSSPELPSFAAPLRGANGAPAPRPTVLGLSMRQALLGGSASVDSVAGATLLADFELDFFARALDAAPPLFPEPRLRTARVFLLWPRTEVMFGMDTPLISDLNPISTAAVGIPLFATAGNLWNWLPQLRLTRTLVTRGEWSVAVQGAALTPNASDRPLSTTVTTDIGLASGRPALESRLRVRRGAELDEQPALGVWKRGAEIGVGTHTAWLRPAADSTLRSWAVSADLHAALPYGFEVRGEVYRGALVRGLGGGAIGQNFGTLGAPATALGVPLTDTAGWLQLNAQWHPSFVHGVGCGIDRVHESRADRRRNSVCAAQVTWRPAVPLFLSLEFRDVRTRYSDRLWRANHWNLAFGIDL